MSATAFTSHDLTARTMHRRAVEAVNWGIPAVNYDRIYQAAVNTGADFNQIVYWSGPANWKNQTLTPDPEVVYVMPLINTKIAGPVVLEVPPADTGSIAGSMMDCWQSPLEDAGPAGADEGKGGKYLFWPPDSSAAAPHGYVVLRSCYYQNYALLRSISRSGCKADAVRAVAYAKRIRVYPLSQAGKPLATKFVNVIDRLFDSTIPYDMRFFESLDRMVQVEPWSPRDKVMIDMLKSIGIEKGKQFAPDATTRSILEDAAREAQAWFDLRFQTAFRPYYRARQWVVASLQGAMDTMGIFFEKRDGYAVDARALVYHYAFATSKHPGRGWFHLFTMRDTEGRFLDGGRNYRLTIPANVPARQYWSAVVYDRATYALVRDVSRSSRSSQSPDLWTNPDHSVDIYFGPEPPKGWKTNWIPTRAGGQFVICIHFYAPEKPLFERTWKLPDVEEVAAAQADLAA
jgi:hypothetical protein